MPIHPVIRDQLGMEACAGSSRSCAVADRAAVVRETKSSVPARGVNITSNTTTARRKRGTRNRRVGRAAFRSVLTMAWRQRMTWSSGGD
jgi:hypothetical protein